MRRVAALVGATALVTGCGSEGPEPVEDATQLEQNIPTDVDGHRVIAYNMTEDTGVVDVDGHRTRVSTGSTLRVGPTRYEVVQIVPDGDEDGPDGWVSIRER